RRSRGHARQDRWRSSTAVPAASRGGTAAARTRPAGRRARIPASRHEPGRADAGNCVASAGRDGSSALPAPPALPDRPASPPGWSAPAAERQRRLGQSSAVYITFAGTGPQAGRASGRHGWVSAVYDLGLAVRFVGNGKNPARPIDPTSARGQVYWRGRWGRAENGVYAESPGDDCMNTGQRPAFAMIARIFITKR